MDQQLSVAAKSFCSQEVTLSPDDNSKLLLSKLMLWYKSDFGSTDADVVRTLAGFVKDEALSKAMKEGADKMTLVFKDYDWKINKA